MVIIIIPLLIDKKLYVRQLIEEFGKFIEFDIEKIYINFIKHVYPIKDIDDLKKILGDFRNTIEAFNIPLSRNDVDNIKIYKLILESLKKHNIITKVIYNNLIQRFSN